MTNFEETNPIIMASMGNIGYRGINNARIASRMKQVVVLIVVIIIGMIVSLFINA